MLIFTDALPLKVYVLYTRENVDIFGWPLNQYIIENFKTHTNY